MGTSWHAVAYHGAVARLAWHVFAHPLHPRMAFARFRAAAVQHKPLSLPRPSPALTSPLRPSRLPAPHWWRCTPTPTHARAHTCTPSSASTRARRGPPTPPPAPRPPAQRIKGAPARVRAPGPLGRGPRAASPHRAGLATYSGMAWRVHLQLPTRGVPRRSRELHAGMAAGTAAGTAKGPTPGPANQNAPRARAPPSSQQPAGRWPL